MTKDKGFTLIETLVAITILTIAVAAPLTLAAQSLMAAFNSRDQVTAFHLAQEAVETVRAQRDHNLLEVVHGNNINWLTGLTVELTGDPNKPFMVDSISTGTNFALCSGAAGSTCENLQFDKSVTGFYGHIFGGNNFNNVSRFKRFVRITEVPNTAGEEVTVRAEVQWRSGSAGSIRKVIVEENLFKWIVGVTN